MQTGDAIAKALNESFSHVLHLEAEFDSKIVPMYGHLLPPRFLLTPLPHVCVCVCTRLFLRVVELRCVPVVVVQASSEGYPTPRQHRTSRTTLGTGRNLGTYPRILCKRL